MWRKTAAFSAALFSDLLLEFLQLVTDSRMITAKHHDLWQDVVSQRELPDEDAISTDVIRIIDDPVLSLELMGPWISYRIDGGGSHPQLQDNLNAAPSEQRWFGVVLCYIDDGCAVDTSACILRELLTLSNPETCAKDAAKSFFGSTMVCHCPATLIFAQPAIVTIIVGTLHLHCETFPPNREVVLSATSIHLPPIILGVPEVLHESKFEHLLRSSLNFDTCLVQCFRKRIEEETVAQPIRSL
mmetsp:Transcript_70879/g.156376  ORF Transcript_70879/g.156376 Transcript_70879/m.156376 type:complete len:243 (-) Transcript_70879:453-1181(-)